MNILNTLLPLGSAAMSFLFAAFVFDQWLQRRRSFQLVWALGLVWFGIGAGCEFVGAVWGWNQGLYRAWYLFGALLVAAYLGAGTVYLLTRSSFGYLAAFSVFAGGLFAELSQVRLIHEGHPAPQWSVFLVIAIATLAGLVIAATTARRRQLTGHVTMAILAAGTVTVALLVATAAIPGGYRLDPSTHVPVGAAMPGYLRIVTGPFNIAGAFCLVFGALYSLYVYMPKRKVLSSRLGVVAVVVNLLASLPRAAASLASGKLNSRVPATTLIALGGFIPSLTSGLNRFGITWAFYLGEFLGVVLIFVGFLVSEEVFRNLRIPAGITLWRRSEPRADAL